MDAWEAMERARVLGQIAALQQGARVSRRHRLEDRIKLPGEQREIGERERLLRELGKAADAVVLAKVQIAEREREPETREPEGEEPVLGVRAGERWRAPQDGVRVAERGLCYWRVEWEHRVHKG